MLGYAMSLGKDYTLSASYTKRVTKDILETMTWACIRTQR